ncbi:unnamed protein product, partial [Hapterophycus canaliculatus]
PPRLQELGGSHVLCGLARLIMCMAEVPFFYLSGPLIRRLGARGVIILAQAAYLARFIYYATLRDPWWVLPSEVLHGLTYAAMWAATIDYAHGVAPGTSLANNNPRSCLGTPLGSRLRSRRDARGGPVRRTWRSAMLRCERGSPVISA